MSKDRKARDADTRDANKQPVAWSPVSTLPVPDPQDGWVFRWIRTSMMNEQDNRNVSKRLREGWEPVNREDHPELALEQSDRNSEWGEKGALEIGGLLLCKGPEEMADQRSAHYRQMAEGQLDAIDNQLMGQSDPRMPILAPDRKTKTTFGSGGQG
tara:strand:- start:6826 stop:7293 length:468 start_codon:yes stop_codon:yes gene_type:complete